jgi:hypothetical protein
MKQHRIQFILIQIDEAHSSRWPVSLPETPEPHTCFDDRLERANMAAKELYNWVDLVNGYHSITIYVDGFNNQFAEIYRAWPDVYYQINPLTKKVLAKSKYGKYGDAVIDKDCLELIVELMSE